MTRLTVTYAVRGGHPQSRHIVSAIDVLSRAIDWAPAQLIGELTQEGVITEPREVRLHSITPGHVREELRLVCSGCGDVRPDADVMGEGVSLGARCGFIDCDGTYVDDAAHTCAPGINYGCAAPGCDGDTD